MSESHSEESSDFFFSRHTFRPDPPTVHDSVHPESPDYKGITEPGVELAQERTKEIETIIEEMSADGIMFIGGATEFERTKSTGEVYGDTLAEDYKDRNDIAVFTREQLEQGRKQARETDGKVLEMVQESINYNPDKKLVFVYPLFIKEFSLSPEFRDFKTGKLTEYADTLLNKVGGGREDDAADTFMRSGGKVESEGHTIEGISPQEIAEKYMHGISRLQIFAKKFANGREVVVGIIGHGWVLDSFVSYLANNGVAGAEGWDATGATPIDKTELGKVSIKEGQATFTYRGKAYPIDREPLK